MEMRTADAFLAAVRVAADLVARPEVAGRWTDESACAGMSVGALAQHLAAQAGNTVALLKADPVALSPIPLLEHYRRAAWVTAGLDEEPNTSIRDGAEERAGSGPDALVQQVQADLAVLPVLLAAERSPDTVHVTWQGWALSTDDYLVSRMMELVVHSDDLAASLGVETPEFPEAVVQPVVALLSALAARRHGATAVVRALARPQRASGHVSAF